VEAASAGDGVVVGDLCSASEEGRAQIVEMAGDEGGMGFFRCAEILFDADVNLLVAALKPAPTARAKGLGFLYFRHSQERAVKFASGRLATLGSGNLEVIDSGDADVHSETRIPVWGGMYSRKVTGISLT
jgi:hypothetical protein